MAYTLSPNLRLRLDSNLTANAKYNLLRLDALGAVFNLDNTDNAVIRSAEGIIFRPNDTTAGGSGSGGTVQFGSNSQPIASLNIHADEVSFASGLSLADQGTAGTKHLYFQYDSTLSGAVDTAADRTLKFDLQGADRELILGGNLTLGGGSLTLNLASDLSLNMPANGVGLLLNDGAGNLSWSTAGSGTVTSVGLSAPAMFAVSGSPVTSAGTLGLSFTNQPANWFMAGPTSGGAAQPDFRALTAADIQSIPGYRAMSATWTSGTTKVITHNWGTRKIVVEILDGNANYVEVMADSEERDTDNTITLTTNQAPTNWLVLLKEVP